MKKILAVCLCLALTLSCLSLAFAANESGGEQSLVRYEASETYTVSVPEYIIPQDVDEEVDTDAYSVSASNVRLPDGKELKVSVAYDGTLTEANGVEIPYKLVDSNGDITSGDVILTQTAGQPDAVPAVTFGAAVLEKAKYAGVYTDTATFVTDASEKTYTAEEIEADEHLFAIGRTKPEYVVARFNEDFSEVTIFKNGEDSDGDMRSFSYKEGGVGTNKNIVSPMIEHSNTLISAVIEEGVTTIGGFAFYQCSNLQSVIFPSTLIEIGKGDTGKENDASDGYVFYECSKLQMPNFQNGLQKIRERSFYETTALTGELIMPDSVSDVDDSAFAYSGITAAYISKGMKTISDSTFWRCYDLKIVDIPNTIVTIEDGAFYDTGLETVYIPDSVVSIGESFDEDYDTLGIVWGRGVFAACDNLLSITGAKSVTFLGDETFKGSEKLKEIPEFSNVETIGGGAFSIEPYGVNDLKLNISPNVKKIGGLGISQIRTVTVDPQNAYFVQEEGVIYNSEKTKVYGSDKNSVSSFPSIPNTLEYIDAYSFSGCENFISLDLSKTKVKELSYGSCLSVSEIIFGEDTNSITIDAFSPNLTSIIVPENNQSYKSIDGVLFTKDGTQLVLFPGSKASEIYSVPEGTTIIGESAFADTYVNNALQQIDLPASVREIMSHGFYNCPAKIINIAEGLEIIGSYAFGSYKYASNIVEISLPKTIININKNAFNYCKNLSSITIKSPTCVIEDGAFNQCAKLTTICGCPGSPVEEFATANGYTFVPIEDTTEAATQSLDSATSSILTASR